MSRFESIRKHTKDAIKDKVDEVVDSKPKIVSKAKNLATDVQNTYVERGAKEKVDAVQSQISGKLDEVSGQAMYQLVEERLTEQDRFNDLLATKLHEALERISELEKRPVSLPSRIVLRFWNAYLSLRNSLHKK